MLRLVDSSGKLNDWADDKTNILSSTAGDNGADSVFSEPMGLNLNHDSVGPANPNDLFGETKDSGVGRSPRAPGSGSDPRSLGESSLPPAWLQDVRVLSVMYVVKEISEAPFLAFFIYEVVFVTCKVFFRSMKVLGLSPHFLLLFNLYLKNFSVWF